MVVRKSFLVISYVSALSLFFFFIYGSQVVHASTFTVNSTGDTASTTFTNQGICNDGNGNCTFRAAILAANATSGAHTINFSIASSGVQTITLTSAPPLITIQNLTIDGTTEAGSSCGDLWSGISPVWNIVIDGNA